MCYLLVIDMGTVDGFMSSIKRFHSYVESRGEAAVRLQQPAAMSFAAKIAHVNALTTEGAEEPCQLGDACLGEHTHLFEQAVHDRIAKDTTADAMHTSKQGQILERLDNCFTRTDLLKAGPDSNPLCSASKWSSMCGDAVVL